MDLVKPDGQAAGCRGRSLRTRQPGGRIRQVPAWSTSSPRAPATKRTALLRTLWKPSLVRLDPPQFLAEIHREHQDRTRLRSVLERYRLLNDQPVKFRETIGIELLPRIEPLQSALIDQVAQLVRRQTADLAEPNANGGRPSARSGGASAPGWNGWRVAPHRDPSPLPPQARPNGQPHFAGGTGGRMPSAPWKAQSWDPSCPRLDSHPGIHRADGCLKILSGPGGRSRHRSAIASSIAALGPITASLIRLSEAPQQLARTASNSFSTFMCSIIALASWRSTSFRRGPW